MTEIVWSENGERNSRSYRSLELVPSLNYHVKTTNFYSVATFISNSPAETEAIGRRLAEDVGVGSVLALQGDLGSGKTLLRKASSPAWEARLPLPALRLRLCMNIEMGVCQFTISIFFAWRVDQCFARLGLDDYFFGDGVSVIEWADRFPKLHSRTSALDSI